MYHNTKSLGAQVNPKSICFILLVEDRFYDLSYFDSRKASLSASKEQWCHRTVNWIKELLGPKSNLPFDEYVIFSDGCYCVNKEGCERNCVPSMIWKLLERECKNETGRLSFVSTGDSPDCEYLYPILPTKKRLPRFWNERKIKWVATRLIASRGSGRFSHIPITPSVYVRNRYFDFASVVSNDILCIEIHGDVIARNTGELGKILSDIVISKEYSPIEKYRTYIPRGCRIKFEIRDVEPAKMVNQGLKDMESKSSGDKQTGSAKKKKKNKKSKVDTFYFLQCLWERFIQTSMLLRSVNQIAEGASYIEIYDIKKHEPEDMRKLDINGLLNRDTLDIGCDLHHECPSQCGQIVEEVFAGGGKRQLSEKPLVAGHFCLHDDLKRSKLDILAEVVLNPNDCDKPPGNNVTNFTFVMVTSFVLGLALHRYYSKTNLAALIYLVMMLVLYALSFTTKNNSRYTDGRNFASSTPGCEQRRKGAKAGFYYFIAFLVWMCIRPWVFMGLFLLQMLFRYFDWIPFAFSNQKRSKIIFFENPLIVAFLLVIKTLAEIVIRSVLYCFYLICVITYKVVSIPFHTIFALLKIIFYLPFVLAKGFGTFVWNFIYIRNTRGLIELISNSSKNIDKILHSASAKDIIAPLSKQQ